MQNKASVCLIVPVYNEGQHLAEFLKALDSLELGREKKIVLIDDCSTDNSFEIVKNFSFRSSIVVERQKFNQGKGAAIRRGIEIADADLIAVQDADFEYDMSDLKSLLDLFDNDRTDVVYGSRFKKTGTQVHRTFHYLVNRLLTILSNAFSGLYLSDMETCYKVFKSEIIKNIKLETNRFGFEPEVTAKIAKLKVHVHEVPIRYFPRSYIEGKKISWKDGIAAIFHIFRFNLLRNNESCFRDALPSKYRVKGRQWL